MFNEGSSKLSINRTAFHVQSSTLFPCSALPRHTSHELALGVDSATLQIRTMPSPSQRTSGAVYQTGNSNPPQSEMNSRSLRRVTFSNPEYISAHLRNSARDIKDNIGVINLGTEGASVTSLTSGSYVVQAKMDDLEDESWKPNSVSYILV